jgi:hypothetical protein
MLNMPAMVSSNERGTLNGKARSPRASTGGQANQAVLGAHLILKDREILPPWL